MKRFSWTLITVLLTYVSAEAQKVKYKDLYPLLDSRQYELAIPLLKSFLAESKTMDHPNGNFQLATYYELQTLDQDILKNSVEMTLYADSAVAAYQKTLTVLTEKEVSKRNPEYYQAYSRRDVRTGKVGIKLSNIQYDLEKKIGSLNDRKVAVNNINLAKNLSDSAYSTCQNIYKEFRATYSDTRRLYLQADEVLISKLDTLMAQIDLAIVNAGRMKTELGKIEKAGYDPQIEIKEIESYENDGMTEADYFADDVVFWEYGNWAKAVKETIDSKIKPMISEVIAYDAHLNTLRERTLSDSTSFVSDIKPIEPIATSLKEFDQNALPLRIFDVKQAELGYLGKLMEHRDYRDSADLVYVTNILSEKVSALKMYDSLLNVLADFPYKEEEINYFSYLSKAFGNMEQFESYIETNKNYADTQFEQKNLELEAMKERANWLIAESDSIPLFRVDDAISSNKYLPVVIDSLYTAGLFFGEDNVVQGYFSLINKLRIPESKVIFDVDASFFNRINILDIEALVEMDDSGQIYHLLFTVPMPEQETYAAKLCKIYTADGLAWEKNLTLDTKASAIEVVSGSGQVEIKYDLENYSGDTDLTAGISLDKKGELINK